jgi:flagellar FliL protein
MPEKPTDSRLGARAEPPPEEPKVAPPTAKSPLFGKSWLPLLITVVAMPLLAYATTRFVLVPEMKRALTPAEAAPVEPGAASPKEGADSRAAAPGTAKVTVQLNKILVNVAGTMGTRYLMTSLTLVGTDPTVKEKIEQNQAQLLDLATGTLCTKTISDMEKPGARNVIRAELLTIFNNALGGPIIKEIYITEMAIQ